MNTKKSFDFNFGGSTSLRHKVPAHTMLSAHEREEVLKRRVW